jgi:type II secretory pathway component GspD/PulD (secretin)
MALFKLVMSFDELTLKQAIDDLANALQAAVVISERLQATLSSTNQDTATLQQALRRAAVTLHRLQPR